MTRRRDDPETGPNATSAGEDGDRSAARKRRWWHWSRPWPWLGLLALSSALLVFARGGLASRLILEEAITRVGESLAGEIIVDSLAEGDIFKQMRLKGVGLMDEDGQPIFTADSIALGSSLASLLVGGLSVDEVAIWGLDGKIARLPSEAATNVDRLFAPEGSATAPGEDDLAPDTDRAERSPLRIEKVSIRDSFLDIAVPVGGGDDQLLGNIPASDGSGSVSELPISGIDLDLEDVTLWPEDSRAEFVATVASLSADLELNGGGVRVHDLSGHLTYTGGEGVVITQGSLSLAESTLAFQEARVEPPDTQDTGRPWTFTSRFVTVGAASGYDFTVIEPRLAGTSINGEIGLATDRAILLDFSPIVVEERGGTARLEGGLLIDREGDRYDSVEVTVESAPSSLVERWFKVVMPENVRLSGDAILDGEGRNLAVSGVLALHPEEVASPMLPPRPDGPPTVTSAGDEDTEPDPAAGTFSPTPETISATVRGWIDLGERGTDGEELRARELVVRVQPFSREEVTLLGRSRADFPLRGRNRLEARLDGGLTSGLTFDLDLTNGWEGRVSPISVRGEIRQGELSEFEIEALTALDSLPLGALGLEGEVGSAYASGAVSISGRARDAGIDADLEIDGGRLAVSGVADIREPGAFYRFGLQADSLPVSSLFPELPEPTSINMRADVEGRGRDLNAGYLSASVSASSLRTGPLTVDTLAAQLSVEGGFLNLATMITRVGGVSIAGSGRIGLNSPSRGEIRFDARAESVAGLRELVIGPVGPVKDTLTSLQRTLLAITEVDVEALPEAVDVRLDGRLRGRVALRGSLEDFDLELDLGLAEMAYRREEIDSLTLRTTVRGLPEFDNTWTLDAEAGGLRLYGRRVETASVSGVSERGVGKARVDLRRGSTGALALASEFTIEDEGVEIGVTELGIAADTVLYELARPAQVSWGSQALSFNDLRLERRGASGKFVTASGTLARVGITKFDVVVEGVELAHIGELGGFGDWPASGNVTLTAAVVGPSNAPRIEADWIIVEPRFEDFELSSLTGSASYQELSARVKLSGMVGEREVLRAQGPMPVDLGLTRVADRTPDGLMDMAFELDSLPAASALAALRDLEGVSGVISGSARLGGNLDVLRPDGELEITDFEWSLPALGIRPPPTDGVLGLNRDGSVDLRLATRGGELVAEGTVDFSSVANPALDVNFMFDEFLAVSRADMEAVITGEIGLGGRYLRPVAQGAVIVDRGTLFTEEFERTAYVIDLSDPRLFGTDTTFLAAQPFLRGLSNPFLANLRTEIDLEVPRDLWLRSPEMSVEMGGELSVSYDRRQGDIVLVGELEALRGNYSLLQRSFEVSGGSVSFTGIPGVNPNLDVTAVSRIRRREGEPLQMTATVEGTLTAPEVSLTSDEAGLDQADLIGYLLLGRPVSGLASQNPLSQATTGALATLISGAAASQLGTALAQEIGVDYLSITQAGDYTLAGLASPLATTEVEIGQYIGQDAFAVLVLRPLAQQTGVGGFFGGVRVDWGFGDEYWVETFVADRYLRGGSGGLGGIGTLGGLGIAPQQIVGVFLFKEIGW